MALLFDEDYQILKDSGLQFEEDEGQRFLVIKDYPLKAGLYENNGKSIDKVDVLVVIPTNYNTSGNDMFWTNPLLNLADGNPIPNVSGIGGQDPRIFNEVEFCRWSRHYRPDSWTPKEDNILKILSRIEWSLKNPNSQK